MSGQSCIAHNKGASLSCIESLSVFNKPDFFSLFLYQGAVACVQNIANPISLARKVMTDTPHCMLAGEGALKFARSVGIPVLEDPRSLISDRSHQIYMKEKLKREDLQKEADYDTKDTAVEKVSQENKNTWPEGHDTVGAVAMDTNGHIAVSNSTGNELSVACDTVICHKLPVLQIILHLIFLQCVCDTVRSVRGVKHCNKGSNVSNYALLIVYQIDFDKAGKGSYHVGKLPSHGTLP